MTAQAQNEPRTPSLLMFMLNEEQANLVDMALKRAAKFVDSNVRIWDLPGFALAHLAGSILKDDRTTRQTKG